MLYTKTIDIGLSYYIGLLISKANVICPLDNDDLWFPNRLETLIRLFKEEDDLVLIKNEILPFRNRRNFILRVAYMFTMNLHFRAKGVLHIIERNSYSIFLGRPLLHNSSSMSFKKNLFLNEDLKNTLKKVIALSDPFFFFSALVSEGKIGYFDSPLTLYRVENNLGPSDFKIEVGHVSKMRYQFNVISELFEKRLMSNDKTSYAVLFKIFNISMKIELNLKSQENNALSLAEIVFIIKYSLRLKSPNLMLLISVYFLNKYLFKKIHKR